MASSARNIYDQAVIIHENINPHDNKVVSYTVDCTSGRTRQRCTRTFSKYPTDEQILEMAHSNGYNVNNSFFKHTYKNYYSDSDFN